MFIKPSTRQGKRYMATFKDGTIIHFGLKGGSTYIDEGDKQKRSAYIARHRVNEDFNNPKTAGSLSRHILWGDSTSLSKNISAFKSKFKV
tara:strand:+ start:50 stop:319 length:270 start_codon:yes stop_codon:yes gene_type:complete